MDPSDKMSIRKSDGIVFLLFLQIELQVCINAVSAGQIFERGQSISGGSILVREVGYRADTRALTDSTILVHLKKMQSSIVP